MMYLRTIILLIALALPAVSAGLTGPDEPHLANIRQLTFGGENAEAYFSFDGKQLVFQSTREPFRCDRIFTMDLDGSNLRQVSNGQGQYIYNPGIDILREPGKSAKGQAVYAAARGRVVAIEPGVSILIEHTFDSRKVWTQYINVDRYKKLKAGDLVAKGQQIGTINRNFLRFVVAYEQHASGDAAGKGCGWIQGHYENPFLWLGAAAGGGKTEAASCP